MPFQLTSTGLEVETEDEILARLGAQAQATISPSLDISQNSIVGRLLAIFAQEVAQNQEVALSLWNSFSDLATGQALDNRAALTGTTRRDATFSTVTATVEMDSGTSVAAGEIVASVSGNPDAVFSNDEAFTAPSTGNHNLAFTATTSGPVQAPAGQLTVLEVTISGVTSITNASNAEPGDFQESDADLRIRRRTELTAQGSGTQDSLVADVSRVDDVEFVAIEVNSTNTTNGLGLPAHSFEIICFGGLDDDIAQVIWDNQPSGIATYGNTSGTAVDDGGNNQTVNFSRPTQTRIYCDITLTTNPNTYGGDAAVQQAIASFTDGSLEIELPNGQYLDGGLGVGDDVILSQLYSAIYTVPGVIDVTDIKVDTVKPPVATGNYVTGPREIVAHNNQAGIGTDQISDITVTSS